MDTTAPAGPMLTIAWGTWGAGIFVADMDGLSLGGAELGLEVTAQADRTGLEEHIAGDEPGLQLGELLARVGGIETEDDVARRLGQTGNGGLQIGLGHPQAMDRQATSRVRRRR